MSVDHQYRNAERGGRAQLRTQLDAALVTLETLRSQLEELQLELESRAGAARRGGVEPSADRTRISELEPTQSSFTPTMLVDRLVSRYRSISASELGCWLVDEGLATPNGRPGHLQLSPRGREVAQAATAVRG
jgi:hypothetical protein